jgi:hypothetical protein
MQSGHLNRLGFESQELLYCALSAARAGHDANYQKLERRRTEIPKVINSQSVVRSYVGRSSVGAGDQ